MVSTVIIENNEKKSIKHKAKKILNEFKISFGND